MPNSDSPTDILESRDDINVDYFVVLDFEATCEEGGKLRPQEIIEFPTLLVDVTSGNVESIFQHYVRPEINPILTEYCTDLTGIEQSQVDNGILCQMLSIDTRNGSTSLASLVLQLMTSRVRNASCTSPLVIGI